MRSDGKTAEGKNSFGLGQLVMLTATQPHHDPSNQGQKSYCPEQFVALFGHGRTPSLTSNLYASVRMPRMLQ